MRTKTCIKCNKSKALSQFYKVFKSKSYRANCKACMITNGKASYQHNKDTILLKQKVKRYSKPLLSKKVIEVDDFTENFTPIQIFHDKKACRKCKGLLELSRYYDCLLCKPELSTDAQDDFQANAYPSVNMSEMEFLEGSGTDRNMG